MLLKKQKIGIFDERHATADGAATFPAGFSPGAATGMLGSDRRLSPGRRTNGRSRFRRALRDGKGELMASDISLAVGDGARRMTYAELAAARGISPASAKRLTQRHRWGRQIGNDGVVRVIVPLSALVNSAEGQGKNITPDNSMPPATTTTGPVTPAAITGDVTNDVAGDVIPATDVLARAIETLREQLVKANQREEAERRRAEYAEHRLEVERQLVENGRKRVDELQTALVDAVAAERITASEASALRSEVDRLRARRRWFWQR